MPSITFRGQDVPVVPMDKMLPSEVDAIERVTQMTFKQIGFRSKFCACTHSQSVHMSKQPDGSNVLGACGSADCPCDDFDPDMPSRVGTALMWVSIKRAMPEVKFADVDGTPLDELSSQDVAPDPTQPSETDSPTHPPATEETPASTS